MNKDPKLLQEKIGYTFKDEGLLVLALSHSSYANEKDLGYFGCNERLEFLGDAVLELISSRILFIQRKDLKEGELSKLRAAKVCEEALVICAEKISLSDFLLLGKGEDKSGGRGRASIVSDAMEALIGAIYLDGGIRKAESFIKKFIITDIRSEEVGYYSDFKTELQEYLQAKGMVPVYELTGESGPSHNKEFSFRVLVDGVPMGEGTGRTKKYAEQMAAQAALSVLKKSGE